MARRHHWRSLRTRLTLWNIAILAVMLTVLGTVAHYTVRARIMASVDQELTMAVRRFTGPHRRPDQGFRPNGMMRPNRQMRPNGQMLPDALPGGRGGPNGQLGPPPGEQGPPPGGGPDIDPLLGQYSPRMLDLQGHVLSPWGGDGPWDKMALKTAATGRAILTTTVVDDEQIRVLSQPLPPNGPVVRVVQIPYPLAEVNRAMSGLNWGMLVLLPVALLCAGLGGAMLTDRALRPVSRVTEAASRIGAEGLSERLPVEGEDEFAELAHTFNAMLVRLEGSFDEQQRLVDELKRLIERERRFTADASHELRTPLTVIKANTSLALGEGSAPGHARQSFEDIDRAADTASRLVQDLLLLARSDAGQLGRDPIALPIADILSRATSAFAHSAGAPIHVNVPDAALCVTGNEDELVRLFTNLLDNARRYTPADGSVTVSALGDGPEVRIQVSDTGSGIAPEHLPHLGERFYRVDPARTRREGGAGLGLSICRGIAEAHGGSLTIESTEGRGTTVSVSLPVAPE